MRHICICSCKPDGGIYHYRQDGEQLVLIDKLLLDRPMYMIIRENKAYVILREADALTHDGGFLTMDIAEDGSLVNPSPILRTHGEVPCHLEAAGDDIYVVNYLSGNIVRLPDRIVTHTGHSVNVERQSAPHTHFVMVMPEDGSVLCTDLGKDTITVYNQALQKQYDIPLSPGSGPRHLAMTEDHKLLLCINELSCTVSVLQHIGGMWEVTQEVPLLDCPVTDADGAAAIRVRGKNVFASVRGADVIVRLQIEGTKLWRISQVACGGRSPRDINFIGNRLYSANEQTDSVTSFELIGNELIQTDEVLAVPAPLCICSIER